MEERKNWIPDKEILSLYQRANQRIIEQSYDEAANSIRKALECMINNMILESNEYTEEQKQEILTNTHDFPLQLQIDMVDLDEEDKEILHIIRRKSNYGSHGTRSNIRAGQALDARAKIEEAMRIYQKYMRAHGTIVLEGLFGNASASSTVKETNPKKSAKRRKENLIGIVILAIIIVNAVGAFIFGDSKKAEDANVSYTIELPVIPGLEVKLDDEKAQVSSDVMADNEVELQGNEHKISFVDEDGILKEKTYKVTSDTSDTYMNQVKYSDASIENAINAVKDMAPALIENYLKDEKYYDVNQYFYTSDIAQNTRRQIASGNSSMDNVFDIGEFQYETCKLFKDDYDVQDGIPILLKGTTDYKWRYGEEFEVETAITECVLYMVYKDHKWVIYDIEA